MAILALDAVGLVGAGIFLLVRAGGHDAKNGTAAATLGAFALVGAALFALLARGCRPARPRYAARTPALMLEVIMIPVSIGLMQSGRPELGVPLLVSALAALWGLATGFGASTTLT